MSNTIRPQLSRNVFSQPSQTEVNRPPSQRLPRSVRQDKGFLTKALAASLRPAPQAKESRARLKNTNIFRSQKRNTARVKLVHTTLWLHPGVRAELARMAEKEGISLSQVGAALLENAIRQSIHSQYNTLLQPMLRQIIREELAAFGNRIVFFLMRIAFASEQARILVTNVLDRILKRDGVPNERFQTLVAQSDKLARQNITQKTPKLKALLEEWESSFPQANRPRGESK